MKSLKYKTQVAKAETVTREWHLVDAEDQIVGRISSEIAKILRGKHKACYTPHMDAGDFIVIINADKVRFTGNKMADKEYIRYSGYPGGQKKATPADLMVKKPTAILENAVRGMLPKNKLGRAMFKKLFVYAGTEHPHTAQQPKEIKF